MVLHFVKLAACAKAAGFQALRSKRLPSNMYKMAEGVTGFGRAAV